MSHGLQCYYCGRFIALGKARWIDELVSVAERIDPPDFVPICPACDTHFEAAHNARPEAEEST